MTICICYSVSVTKQTGCIRGLDICPTIVEPKRQNIRIASGDSGIWFGIGYPGILSNRDLKIRRFESRITINQRHSNLHQWLVIIVNVFFTNEADKNDGELLSTSFCTELRCASFWCQICSMIFLKIMSRTSKFGLSNNLQVWSRSSRQAATI